MSDPATQEQAPDKAAPQEAAPQVTPETAAGQAPHTPPPEPPPSSRAGRVNVTLGPKTEHPHPARKPPQAEAPAPAAPPKRPPVLQALLELRNDVRDQRKGIDIVLAKIADDTQATKGTADSLDELKGAIQTLESYVSLGFFDRVRTTIQDISDQDPRQAALQSQVSGLRRTVSRMMILQVISLAAVVLLVMADTNALGKLERGADMVLDATRPAWGPIVDYLDGDAAPTLESIQNETDNP